jgi:thioredoxin-dependent peroxiredoxin
MTIIHDFELPSTGPVPFRFSKAVGRKLVLYFYPKDNTPGCTTEGRDFASHYSKFRQAGCEVYGISRDSLKSHGNFRSKCEFPFDLLSDTEENVCGIFGVIKMKNMYGKQVRGVERSTFVFDREGKLAREWRGVKVPGHAQEVLDFVRTLK